MVIFSGAGNKKVSSWFASPESVIKEGLDPARLSEAPDLKFRYRLEFRRPKPSQIVFTPDTLHVINDAIQVATVFCRGLRGTQRKMAEPLLLAMKNLSKEITRQDEGEVIVYSKDAIRVKVLEDLKGEDSLIDEDSDEDDTGEAPVKFDLKTLYGGRTRLEPGSLRPRTQAVVSTQFKNNVVSVPVLLLFPIKVYGSLEWVISSEFEGFRYDKDDEDSEPPTMSPNAFLAPVGDEFQDVFRRLQESFDDDARGARLGLDRR
jgi:hypothetical protein